MAIQTDIFRDGRTRTIQIPDCVRDGEMSLDDYIECEYDGLKKSNIVHKFFHKVFNLKAKVKNKKRDV